MSKLSTHSADIYYKSQSCFDEIFLAPVLYASFMCFPNNRMIIFSRKYMTSISILQDCLKPICFVSFSLVPGYSIYIANRALLSTGLCSVREILRGMVCFCRGILIQNTRPSIVQAQCYLTHAATHHLIIQYFCSSITSTQSAF